jgi:amidohydrolase
VAWHFAATLAFDGPASTTASTKELGGNMQDVLDWLKAAAPEFTAIRRDIHAHPERGFEVHRTAKLVADRLRSWGIETTEGVGRTGVVGTIKGNLAGQRAVGLRADMDALPIAERTGLVYASKSPGTMHACGHDGHTAMLLAAARYLAEHRDFAGTVQLIFQPDEEGGDGAKAMLADRLFERFPVDSVYGMHNSPGVPVGTFGIRKGACAAGVGTWRVSFRGDGGHGGASPHRSQDLSIVQAHFILGLQSIVGRNVPPLETAVISVGHLSGGAPDAPNVMPSEIKVEGTVRYYAAEVREILERHIHELAQGLAGLHGATAESSLRWLAAPVINHDEQTDVAAAAAVALVGSHAVDVDSPKSTGGEDFGYMLQAREGAIIGIGNGVGPAGTWHALHTPNYDFNDEILPLGAAYWVSVVRQELTSV